LERRGRSEELNEGCKGKFGEVRLIVYYLMHVNVHKSINELDVKNIKNIN